MPLESPRNPTGKSGPGRGAQTRRAAIEAFEPSGTGIEAFARAFGVSPWTLRCWIKRCKAEGEQGLEPRPRGRKQGEGGLQRVPVALTTGLLIPIFALPVPLRRPPACAVPGKAPGSEIAIQRLEFFSDGFGGGR